MTSKEFIEKLKSDGIYYCKECNLKGCDNCEKERNAQFDSVIKDLEVLEILKSKIRISNYLDVRMLDFPLFLLPMLKEESDKIKEWLENDK